MPYITNKQFYIFYTDIFCHNNENIAHTEPTKKKKHHVRTATRQNSPVELCPNADTRNWHKKIVKSLFLKKTKNLTKKKKNIEYETIFVSNWKLSIKHPLFTMFFFLLRIGPNPNTYTHTKRIINSCQFSTTKSKKSKSEQKQFSFESQENNK